MEKKETETRAKRQTRSPESRVERRRIVIGEREGKIARGESLELRIEQANARSHCFAARPVTQSLLTVLIHMKRITSPFLKSRGWGLGSRGEKIPISYQSLF